MWTPRAVVMLTLALCVLFSFVYGLSNTVLHQVFGVSEVYLASPDEQKLWSELLYLLIGLVGGWAANDKGDGRE